MRTLVARNLRVLALAPDYSEGDREQVRLLGAHPVDFSLSRTGMNPFRDLMDAVRLTVVLRRLRPDIALGFFIKPATYGTLAAWVARVPLRVAMIEGLGFAFTDSGGARSTKKRWLRSLVSLLYWTALKTAHRVVFLNPDDLKEFVQWRLVTRDKSVCLGGIGVDLADWPPAPPVTQPITFILVARLLREKGIREYVEAAGRVKRLFPNTRFLLLGGLDSNPGGIARDEADSWAREGVIEWQGHAKVKPWLEQASVFVLPSYREGVPLSAQEAMAMARPIITTDVPGCRETVIQGENGFLVPARDVSALEQAMIQFISKPELVSVMGLRSRELAEGRFDVHDVNARLLAIMGLD